MGGTQSPCTCELGENKARKNSVLNVRGILCWGQGRFPDEGSVEAENSVDNTERKGRGSRKCKTERGHGQGGHFTVSPRLYLRTWTSFDTSRHFL